MSKAKLFLFVSIVVLFSVSAFAVDGVVVINQASVMAAGGFPYKITQPGSYKLSGNLIPGGENAIDINADNVTLDLNGFSIIGSGTCTGQAPNFTCSGFSGEGVFSEKNNITVKNGNIVGMLDGVFINGTGSLVEEMHISQIFGQGITTFFGIIRRNTVTLASLEGIVADGSTVIENVIVNDGFGIPGVISGFGLNCIFSPCVYGSNIFSGNSTNIHTQGTVAVSQNNNSCDGTAC